MENRAAKRKGGAACLTLNQSQKKKRVVLGELPNFSNAIAPAISNFEFEPLDVKCQKNTKVKKVVATKKSLLKQNSKLKESKSKVKKPVDVDAKSGTNVKFSDPQNCEAYVSDINEYLRKMEVILAFVVCLIWKGARSWP